ncbi:kelch domain-containing protein 3 [Byssothecium circinans]|uniref:Kelch domain-containing protein 3 n=1 Tax=Byssothecium circinans TaxID=147558 RepID=A0A6A5TIN6_9PLEO|nr:kelch domain-containing protein 3 [Byssothecium circinans]
MSFLFGKKNKPSATAVARDAPSALPPATRDITPSHGPNAQVPAPRDPEKARTGPPAQAGTPGSGSVNNSLSSLNQPGNTASPEPSMRNRAEGRDPRNPNDQSPYPWSFRRLNFTTTSSPFPRYGAAINAVSSKDGTIYLMGGLVAGATVKGDLWITEMGNGSMACYPISTTGDGPGPRVGHSSLLVGNAFIVFVEGHFFNDLVAFDLNSLQSSTSRWEVLLPNQKEGTASSPQSRSPPARTNHSVVTWNDKLYLFGGTDGINWFNDVWTYDPRTNLWSELDCIGYIPVAREGHSATLVNDTMYIFGGRTQEGVDLGDLAAFRISSRRWYMFQNMGHSPSARSGHSMTAFGKHVIVLGGEPSSSAADKNELSLAYVLDTSKIRYPPNEAPPPQQALNAPRKLSGGDRSNIPLGKVGSPPARESMMPRPQQADPMMNGMAPGGSRLPRVAGQAPSGPPPMQQPPQPRPNTNGQVAGSRSRTPTKDSRGYGPPVDTRAASLDRENRSPSTRESPSTLDSQAQSLNERALNGSRKASDATNRDPKESMDTSRSGSLVSRNTSKSHRQQHSLDSIEQGATRRSTENQRGTSREREQRPVDSRLGASPAIIQQNDGLARELEALKSRNAWYASELALARKAGYNAGIATSPVLDERSVEAFGDEDKPFLEALLKMKGELERVQTSIKTQGQDAAKRIAEVERQRDAAISEAIYAKAKLAAHGGGSQAGTPQPDGARSTATPDLDRVADINRRLAASLAAQSELASRVEKLTVEVEVERKAKQLADDTTEAAQKRVQELDSTRQKNASESESLRAALHETERVAREASVSAAEAEAASKLLAVDKSELSAKLNKLTAETKNHNAILQSLREALAGSSDKSALLEKQLEEERFQRENLRQKLAQLRADARFGTPELNRVRELEQQIDSMSKAHDEMRAAYEQREVESNKEWEEKLQALHNDHQAAVKYLRGTEKMLTKMKQELDRYKHEKAKLEEELSNTRQASRSPTKDRSAEWAAERASLQAELSSVQDNMKTSVSRLESQLNTLQSELASARQESEAAVKRAKETEATAEQSRSQLETLRRTNADLEERAREAEERVQMFLTQFETSVDNYRRQSQIPAGATTADPSSNLDDSLSQWRKRMELEDEEDELKQRKASATAGTGPGAATGPGGATMI